MQEENNPCNFYAIKLSLEQFKKKLNNGMTVDVINDCGEGHWLYRYKQKPFSCVIISGRYLRPFLLASVYLISITRSSSK